MLSLFISIEQEKQLSVVNMDSTVTFKMGQGHQNWFNR